MDYSFGAIDPVRRDPFFFILLIGKSIYFLKSALLYLLLCYMVKSYYHIFRSRSAVVVGLGSGFICVLFYLEGWA